MTACATESIANGRTARHSTFTIAADGAYAARLNASAEDGWFPERWTLDGPEPYAVPLPGDRPEETSSQVLPLTDGRVLIARRDGGAHRLALLYPTGPSTGELALGTVESERLTLLPPAPCGRRAYALTTGEHSSAVWLVAGGGDGGPRLVAEIRGRCAGGAWLDREGRLLAVDRTDTAGSGRTKTVAVDLARGGEVSPLLQITDDSNDRLLLADADSGLLIVRSDAPGEVRLGWGVLGSHRPVRFPESLHPDDALLTPFAVQPGQVLLPESCAVALHGQTTEARAGGAWLGVWRPVQKELRRFRAPGGWLPGKGVWTREGELRLPCATAHAPCGLARLRMRSSSPEAGPGATVTGTGTGESLGAGVDVSAVVGAAGSAAGSTAGSAIGSAPGGSVRAAGAAVPAARPARGDEPPSGARESAADGPSRAAPPAGPRRSKPELSGHARESGPGPGAPGSPREGRTDPASSDRRAGALPPEVPPGRGRALRLPVRRAPEPTEHAQKPEQAAHAGQSDQAEQALQTPRVQDAGREVAGETGGFGRARAGAEETADTWGASGPSRDGPTGRVIGEGVAADPAERAPGPENGGAEAVHLAAASGVDSASAAHVVSDGPGGSMTGGMGGDMGGGSDAYGVAAAGAEGTEEAAGSPAGAPRSAPFTTHTVGTAEACVRRKPVPLQDAPLATALHSAAVRARTA